MIAFQPEQDELAFIDVAASFAADKLSPAAGITEYQQYVDKLLINEAAELGFLSLEITEDWEGLELPLITQVQIWKALSYGDLGMAQGFSGTGDAASVIRIASDNSLLSNHKQVIENGSTVAMIDIQDGWRGDGAIRSGQLIGTSQPIRLAKDADYILVTGSDAEGESFILLLDGQENWDVVEGDYRLGLLASGIARVRFNNVAITEKNTLAKGEEAQKLIDSAWTRIRILQAAKEVGLMETALDYATEYTAGRKAFGKEIAKFQGVSFRIASMAMETRLTNHLVWQAALAADEEDEEAKGHSLRALYRAHRSLRYVTDSAVQMLGGHGFVQDFPVEKWMRDAQAQISLYGRERNFLTQRGEQLIGPAKEAPVR